MAEQILFNFAEGILHKLGSYALQQLGLAWGVKKELKRLKNSMSIVRGILLDAEEQQVTNRAVREWMQMLKDILFDVDEMVDDFETEALQRRVEVHGNKLKEVSYFFTRSNPFKVRYSTGRKIKGLRERLDEVLVDMDRFNECRSLRSEANTVIPDGVRHVSFHNEFIIRLPKGSNALHNGKKLRTILTSALMLPVSFTAISPTFRYLRVMDLESWLLSIPSAVFKYLKHLRYLSMRWDHSNLPDSFSRLFNLQYLHLRSKSLKILPKGFKNLINLRHLALRCEGLVFLLDEWIGKLTSLRSLTIWPGRNLTSLPEGFQSLTNLRILVIYVWAELVSLSPGMRYLIALEELCIGWCPNLQFKDGDFQELSNLKSLELICLPLLESLPMGLQCAAPTLTYFRVCDCERLKELSASLENFTSLESLVIVDCPNLLSLPEGIQNLTKLQSLHIRNCPHISRRYSENGGDLWHHISHIPNIHISGD
ncbi:hypothetical protein LguiA_014345 [Lonicera macranthoides]